ncbi:UDP-4-amino-4-deoxy-L-arabinose--oxoglutarate aminotransferase [Rosistilla oblonga]|uniref:DegT/DnrJ/EryC1/StrS family aminotransferase n=1 Tax=Rosistilla oblonga TaxID=2527990 RepID=UPI00118C45BD|nr:DegT/DnrJ/EryC1/StrS family aminotransferase [Rosistilla oblonga]QDV11307.1 UDP-4-amino-4-deoxy-L-arabinose--oxoglutarate aminotransferase [Rosistilla oblonga]
MKVPFFKLSCGDNEYAYVRDVLDSGWLTTAGKAQEFELRFAECVGAKYAVAVNSCTAALHLALDALDVKQGDRVFVPTMTFTATAEVVNYLGAHPVFLDCDYLTRNITPAILRDAITRCPDIKVLMLVHFGGHPAQLLDDENGDEGILAICKRHGIRIVHDAAHAFPAQIDGKSIGGFPDISCFSFYANKTITTGEGGMLATDDEAVYARAKLMRLHGIDRDVWDRFTSSKAGWEYDVVAPGYKYNMPDLAAAVGLAQLENASLFRAARQRCAEVYFARLGSIEAIDLPRSDVSHEDHAWHLFPITLNSSASIERDSLIQELTQAGIGTSVHYKPLHRMTYYRDRYQLRKEKFPSAERLWSGTLSLPLYPTMTNEQLQYVCDQLWRLAGSSCSSLKSAA